MHEYLKPLFNGGLPLNALRAKNLPYVDTTGFDVVAMELPDGQVYNKLVAKSNRIDGSMYVEVNDDCKVVWYESCTLDLFKTTIFAVAAASNTITVKDVKQLQGADVGSELQISTALGLQTVTVLSVNDVTNVITLKAGQTTTVAVGDCVERVGFETVLSCNTNVNNRVTTPNSLKQYTAPFRFFPIIHEFKLCDLNLRVMGGRASTQMKLDVIKKMGEELIYNSIYNAVYFDDQAITGRLRGLFPELKKFQTTCGKSISYDFTTCCDPLDVCGSMDKQFSTLLQIINLVTASGAYGDRKVVFEINKMQWALLTAAEKYFYENQAVSRVNMDGTDSIRHVIPSIAYAGYVISFEYNPYWDKFDKVPFMIAMPSDALQIESKAIVGMSTDFKLMEGSGNIMSGDTPMIKYIDRTMIEGDGF